MKHEIICGDCLDVMATMPKDSVDLTIMDSPYNINKARWDNIPNYVEWMGKVFLGCQRVLKDTGSFYFFHNDFLQLVKLQQWISDNTDFAFKQLLVWDKWHNAIKKGNDLQGAFFKIVNNPDLRNYPKMAEYILYYTFQDETGLKTIERDTTLYKGLREYCLLLREHIEYTREKMLHALGSTCSQHFLEPYGPQWQLCTEETYQKLIVEFGIDKWVKFRTYKSLSTEHKKMREEYNGIIEGHESLRYTFNKTSNDTSILCHPIANTKERVNHITQKPTALIENIIKHSSNEGDTVLDPMCGSGTTLIAAERTQRNSIGIEISKEYCELAYNRLSEEVAQTKFNTKRATIQKVDF